ncbi:hypothetical protein ACFXTH_009370 [Malus domestica]
MANPASIKPVDLPKIELEDDGLIDEDSLLTEEDRKRPDLPVAVTIPSKPPCKKVEMCGLGDAFRCSGCPVKGIPPFILDEKAVLLISPISRGIVTLTDVNKRMLFVALRVLSRVSLVWKQAIRYLFDQTQSFPPPVPLFASGFMFNVSLFRVHLSAKFSEPDS